jgi:hypothetical protein
MIMNIAKLNNPIENIQAVSEAEYPFPPSSMGALRGIVNTDQA